MAHGIDSTYDIIHSTQGTEWHKLALPMTATYHPTHFKVSEFPLSIRGEFSTFQVNSHDKMIMHNGRPDLVFFIMKILARNGYKF